MADRTEFTVGWKKTGLILRYGRGIKGVCVLIRDVEFSLFHYSGINFSWSWILRLPGLRPKTW